MMSLLCREGLEKQKDSILEHNRQCLIRKLTSTEQQCKIQVMVIHLHKPPPYLPLQSRSAPLLHPSCRHSWTDSHNPWCPSPPSGCMPLHQRSSSHSRWGRLDMS